MEIKIKQRHVIGMAAGLVILILDFLLFYSDNSRFFKPVIAIAIIAAGIQFFLDFLNENKRQKEIEAKFLEFVRALVETVRSGIPIPKAIIHISKADYGSLSRYVRKLAYQMEWGVPLREALSIFSKDTKNPIIIRSISIVIEAERSGGNIDEVLQAVTKSVLQIKQIKEERRANTYTQMVQGYFIYFIFIIIMLVMQTYLLPQLSEISSVVGGGFGGDFEGYSQSLTNDTTAAAGLLDFRAIFLGLVLIQGFFAGVMIGKFAEGELKMGLKHSAILMILGYLIITTVSGA